MLFDLSFLNMEKKGKNHRAFAVSKMDLAQV